MTPSTCERISGELVAFLDGELDEGERRPIATHVSTCLVCRREIERLTIVQRWVANVSKIEPGPELAEQLWRRIAAEPEPLGARPGVRSFRSLRWALPALAAAAVLTVSFQFMTRSPLAPVAKPVAGKVAAGPTVKSETRQLANLDDLKPEDLPPELLDHPELFLRLPVVRRLETLEHFEAVHQEHGDQDGAG